jgi:phospholipase C
MSNGIEHIFVLVLENRSFDHMLGFSTITGVDASSGQQTQVIGLSKLSLATIARAMNTTRVSEMARRKGYLWPPPSPVSARDLLIANLYNGQPFRVDKPADYAMSVDPGHEFSDVLTQLCGPNSTYSPGGAYPAISSSG